MHWVQCSNLVMMCCDFLRIIKSFLLQRLNIFLVLRPHCLHLIVMLDYTLGHLFGSLLSRLYRKCFRMPFCIGFELGFRGALNTDRPSQNFLPERPCALATFGFVCVRIHIQSIGPKSGPAALSVSSAKQTARAHLGKNCTHKEQHYTPSSIH